MAAESKIAPWAKNIDSLVFMVGSGRSGTTWLQAMLSMHPHIYSGPETNFFGAFAAAENSFSKVKGRRVGLSEYFTHEHFYGAIADLFRQTLSGLPEPELQPQLFLEKSPHHCLHTDFLLKTFPNARFIHLVRDGRAVVASMLRGSKTWAKDWASSDVDVATLGWIQKVEAAQSLKGRVAPENYIELRYEDLRSNPYQELASLLSWLNVEASAQWIDQAIVENDLSRCSTSERGFGSIPETKQSAVVPSKNVSYPKGFFGKAPYSVQDIELTRKQRLRIEHLAKQKLLELGYAEVCQEFSVVDRLLLLASTKRANRLLTKYFRLRLS